MSKSGESIDAFVLFVKPDGVGLDWNSSGLWESAAGITGVRAMEDLGGVESALFGCETSGHVLLFDKDGIRRFSGGITAARGHEGRNSGLDGLASTCVGLAGIDHSPVFGCPLIDPRPPQ